MKFSRPDQILNWYVLFCVALWVTSIKGIW